MNLKPIYISQTDHARIRARLSGVSLPKRSRSSLDMIRAELDRAVVVNDDSLPPDVVRLDCQVAITDLESSEHEAYTLCLPEQSAPVQNRISVFSPLGTALLGYAAGDELVWSMPGGPRRLRIVSVTPAPVAAQR